MDKVIRVCALPDEEKPKRHTFYKRFGKVGTTSTTIIWFIDEEPEVGKGCFYLDENDHIYPEDKKKYMKYLNHHQVHFGVVDRINSDGYVFVPK